jgi:molybdopterin-containing oxidoreductase family molybdopterin binding subunit
MQKAKPEVKEDVWIPTQCARCYGDCGIWVHRVNGVAVEIQGNPDSTMGAAGGLCGKGLSGLQVLYDPNRLNVPLRRTNPEKGIGVDPKWKEITWDEAYDEIVPRMKKLVEDDSRKIAGNLGGGPSPGWGTGAPSYLNSVGPFSSFIWGGGLQCGAASHPVGGIIHGSWSIVPDFKHCNYALYFGASKGHGSGHSALISARQIADAKARGMKTVVFDPMCNTNAAKAQDWVPVIPGTDLVVVLAMCNIIVNELGTIDEPFLKLKTNAPYLVDPDMKYVRQNGPARGVKGHRAVQGQLGEREPKELNYIGDDETNKPMVWDAGDGEAKVYDDPTIKDYALEGEFEYKGVKCQPSFQLLKEHLKQYNPEMASKISTVPVDTIRRIATEFATEARVGSTITIDGHVLPYRPVAAILFRGGQGHENAFHTCFAVSLLSALVGAIEVPGGTTSWPARTLGYPGKEEHDPGALKWSVFKGLDGFLQNERFGPQSGRLNKNMPFHGPWPIAMPEINHEYDMGDIQPIGFRYVVGGSDREEIWEKLGATYAPELLFMNKNPLMAVGDQDAIAKALKEIPFVVAVEIFNTESTEGFADIVLPDTCYLEKDSWNIGLMQNFNHAWGMDDWSYHITQAVVEPSYQRKHSDDMGYDIADRLGKELGRDLIAESNVRTIRSAPINEEYRPKSTEGKLTAAEIGNSVVKSMFGPEHDWEWFKENGFIRWPKKVEEAYWMWFLDLRIPVTYMEFLVHMKEAVEKINTETGIGIDTAQYTPLISWFPCTTHKLDDPEYDLYCYSYRDILHSGSQTMEQPWLDEASLMNPYTYSVTMNTNTGREKGIEDGDAVEVTTYLGRKEKGTVKLMEGQHPLTVGIAACSGHFADGQPIAKGKGTNFDNLLPMDFEHTDPICGNIEIAVRVSVKKI